MRDSAGTQSAHRSASPRRWPESLVRSWDPQASAGNLRSVGGENFVSYWNQVGARWSFGCFINISYISCSFGRVIFGGLGVLHNVFAPCQLWDLWGHLLYYMFSWKWAWNWGKGFVPRFSIAAAFLSVDLSGSVPSTLVGDQSWPWVPLNCGEIPSGIRT